MTTDPRDAAAAAAAAARGRLRASHADRQQVIDTLKIAFVQGRLTKDELVTRVDETYTSKTYAELAALTTDLPAGLLAAEPALTPTEPALTPTEPAPTPTNAQERSVARRVATTCAVGLFAPTVEAIAFLTGNGLLYAMFLLPTVITFLAWVMAGPQLLGSWREKRSPTAA
ncbi:MAG TPA: DUF1707 domain-containing protein [Streptosporangiaceae bacterium]